MANANELEIKAATWLIRSEAPGFEAREAARLEEWLAEDGRHRATFVRLRAAWGRTEKLRQLRPLDGSINENLLSEVIHPTARR